MAIIDTGRSWSDGIAYYPIVQHVCDRCGDYSATFRLRGDVMEYESRHNRVCRGEAAPALRHQCLECGRVFDLMDNNDAAEWYYGHDCEVM